jgi:hypothetical protein
LITPNAEPVLRAWYDGMKQREKTIREQGKIRLPDAIDRLIELYTLTKKPDKVKEVASGVGELPGESNIASGEEVTHARIKLSHSVVLGCLIETQPPPVQRLVFFLTSRIYLWHWTHVNEIRM